MSNNSRIIITSLISCISACGNNGPDPAVEACIGRGVAYFKEIGSYPILKSAPNTGRSADDVARERCSRTVTAF